MSREEAKTRRAFLRRFVSSRDIHPTIDQSDFDLFF
jgi:hypothetical protein